MPSHILYVSLYHHFYNMLFLISSWKYLACPLIPKSYSSCSVYRFQVSDLQEDSSVISGGKKSLLLLWFIALSGLLLLESSQIILCIKKSVRTVVFSCQLWNIYSLYSPVTSDAFSTLLLSLLRVTRHLWWGSGSVGNMNSGMGGKRSGF